MTTMGKMVTMDKMTEGPVIPGSAEGIKATEPIDDIKLDDDEEDDDDFDLLLDGSGDETTTPTLTTASFVYCEFDCPLTLWLRGWSALHCR